MGYGLRACFLCVKLRLAYWFTRKFIHYAYVCIHVCVLICVFSRLHLWQMDFSVITRPFCVQMIPSQLTQLALKLKGLVHPDLEFHPRMSTEALATNPRNCS